MSTNVLLYTSACCCFAYLAPAVDAEIKGVFGAPGAVLHPGVEGHHGSSASGSAGEGAEVLPLGGLPLVHVALVGKAVVLGALHGAEVSAAGGTGVEVAQLVPAGRARGALGLRAGLRRREIG